MSRSRKKHPYIKDTNNAMQDHCNRSFRHISKQINHDWLKDAGLKKGELVWYKVCLADPPEYPDRRSIVNSYDICDWYYVDKINGYRK